MRRPGYDKAKKRVSLTPGNSIRIAREMLGLTQAQLADLSGMRQSTISALEKNRVVLGVERAKALANALGVHPAVLLFSDWKLEKATA